MRGHERSASHRFRPESGAESRADGESGVRKADAELPGEVVQQPSRTRPAVVPASGTQLLEPGVALVRSA
ncbi:hypothetical protein ACGFYM_13040 [Streptomyces sp. NPDC048231]|uniref:hypothetical protein n=1 Tax=Streptomyces sp. NPDC048231 TaxID=3365519 RepID=UPI003713C029